MKSISEIQTYIEPLLFSALSAMAARQDAEDDRIRLWSLLASELLRPETINIVSVSISHAGC
jgi:hypothetical protein